MAIKILSPNIYNRISAGEVVERPASVVKELVENSLDAGASEIRVEIVGGGLEKIVVSDNGCGLEKDDLPLAFMPHATSKISDLDDLDAISTLGFRGEALASIASVSIVSISTRTKSSQTGFKIESKGGQISSVSEIARVGGTTVTVLNLFFNTPARLKFMRKPKSEESEVTHLFQKFMMSRPDVNFVYVVDGKEVYSHASGKLDEVAYLLYGKDVHENLLELCHEEGGIEVSGYVVSPKISRPNRTCQSLFVNDRYVENSMISACVQGAYAPMLMKGRFPIYIIKLKIDFSRVDVNVHPNKKDVKFDDPNKVFGVVRRAVEKALVKANLVADFFVDDGKKRDIGAELWAMEQAGETDPHLTGFKPVPEAKMEEGEGKSFKISVDDPVLQQKFSTAQDYNDANVDVINQPDFSHVKADEFGKKDKNRNGGNIFFDHSGDSLMHEVEIRVQNMQKDENKSQNFDNLGSFEGKNSSENASDNKKFSEEKQEQFLQASADQIKILGVAFKTYIFAEFEEDLFIIDQHAMHERQNYDRLKKQIENGNVAKQDLLVPFEFVLPHRDAQKFSEKLENFAEIGFDIVQKENRFSVRAVPFVLSGMNIQNFVEEALAENEFEKNSATSFVNEKLCQTACKHSIRAGDTISKEEIFFLLSKIKDGIPLCPHGRPIMVKLSKKDLEKLFKRVV